MSHRLPDLTATSHKTPLNFSDNYPKSHNTVLKCLIFFYFKVINNFHVLTFLKFEKIYHEPIVKSLLLTYLTIENI